MNDPDMLDPNKPIPVLEEFATVGKRTVTTGVITVEKHVETRNYEVSEVLQRRGASVERVPRGITVDPANPPQVRTVDGLTIIPVLEEVLVVEKRLVLKEELQIRYHVDEVPCTQDVTLRSETVVLKQDERNPSDSD
ncbi:DUF2382 domain-containing protein [Pseudomonas capeferrum]|uniref:DUF2382 domain-containing protein n=1 Tax=Pseudomonas capeferrum TaxID=1495066 RepID=UPI0015E45C26|nr:DUF2382 domain-containing protein [Pseudomonas capeferrum]MBA1200714.1 DUF2382 domain-containing protein [Pseudomonas capeferrum]